MNIILYVFALLTGYLFGSISFTRILGKWFAPGEDLSTTEVRMSAEGNAFRMHSVSATSLAFRKGPKAGCLVSLFDMAKAAVPALIFQAGFAGEDFYWLAAAGAVLGHNFPVYYRFKGGRGMSPLYGGLLVIDWLAIPATTTAGLVLGVVLFRDMFVAWTAGVPLLIPWMAWRHGSPISILYSVLVSASFLIAIYPEFRDYLDLKRSGEASQASLKEFFSGANNLFVRRGGPPQDEGKD